MYTLYSRICPTHEEKETDRSSVIGLSSFLEQVGYIERYFDIMRWKLLLNKLLVPFNSSNISYKFQIVKEKKCNSWFSKVCGFLEKKLPSNHVKILSFPGIFPCYSIFCATTLALNTQLTWLDLLVVVCAWEWVLPRRLQDTSMLTD